MSFRLSRVIIIMFILLASLQAHADTWVGTDEGWKFQYDDGHFETGGWKWIDSDRDCHAECYYFQENGSIAVSTTTPDGFRVNADGAWVENGLVQKKDTAVTIAVGGDNLIHQQLIDYGLAAGSFDFLYSRELAEELQCADLAVLSQETIFTDRPDQYNGYPDFGTPVAVGESALRAGFGLAACATNHALDKGIGGINTTAAFYESHDIPYIGIQSTAHPQYEPFRVLTINGVRLALLNYTYGTNGIRIPRNFPFTVHLLNDPEAVRQDIAAARNTADAVLVFAHWGTEFSPDTFALQQSWTNVFLESGVDVVIGTHPHVLQPMVLLERDDGHPMLVYYSLGNLVSAQNWAPASIGGLAEFTIARTPAGCRITDHKLKPVVTHQTDTYSTTYPLRCYTDELAAIHRMHLSVAQWRELFDIWTKGTGSAE
ncbi:MAG: CapA family protein [Lachnospiraceae bacterium]|nr:CapA family protein [Lachnospiraceae bacterium]